MGDSKSETHVSLKGESGRVERYQTSDSDPNYKFSYTYYPTPNPTTSDPVGLESWIGAFLHNPSQALMAVNYSEHYIQRLVAFPEWNVCGCERDSHRSVSRVRFPYTQKLPFRRMGHCVIGWGPLDPPYEFQAFTAPLCQ